MLRKLTCWMFAVIALALHSIAQAQGCNNRFVVFGDSLSDPGNVYAATGETVKAPFEPIPAAPYAIGGHHFSNGMTWAERLAEAIGSPTSGKPEQVNLLFTNYAFGGARARLNSPNSEVSLPVQVTEFLMNFKGACPSPIYIIWIGGNDVRDALASSYTDPTGTTATSIIDAAVTSIAQNIERLHQAGAQKFLVFDAPDISKVPYVKELPPLPPPLPTIEQLAAGLSNEFNSGLGEVIDNLRSSLGIEITQFNENLLFEDIQGNPPAFGLTNAEDPCLSFDVIANAICNAPPKYLFWDAVHPTAIGHAILANEVERVFFP